MIGIPIALAVNNIGEWLIHKYLLHGLGRNKNSFWSFHWHDHHRNARKNNMLDSDYADPFWQRSARRREVIALVAAALPHALIFPIAPFYAVTMLLCIYNYYRVHKKSHQNPEWARKHLPWHADHHLGPNQDANWCVSYPWFDHVMRTRQRYIGSEKEQARRAMHTATEASSERHQRDP